MEPTSNELRRHILLAGGMAAAGMLVGGGSAEAGKMPMTLQGLTPRAYLEKMYAAFFTHPTEPPSEAVKKFTAPTAMHYADGKAVTLSEHIQHLEYLQKNIKSMTFDIQQVVFDGEWLAARHIGQTTLKDGRTIGSEVAIFFHFKDGLVDESHEVTRPLSNNEADRAIHIAR